MTLLPISCSSVIPRGAAVGVGVTLLVGDVPGGNVNRAGTLGGSVRKSGAKRISKMSIILATTARTVLIGAKTA